MMRKIYIPIAATTVACLALGTLWLRDAKLYATAFPTSSTSTQAGASTTPPREAPEGWAEYRSGAYHFSLLVPTTLKVTEYPEQDGGMTVTFEDIEPKTVAGFQIFIAPFDGSQITDARFKEDDPSGMRTGLKNIAVDGAAGVSFYSTDSILGATAEVWFVRGGYLYEVTTLRELAPGLATILATWQFTN
jgi:hypothetical protein